MGNNHSNITLKSLSDKDINDLDDDEKRFLENLSDYLEVDTETLIENIKSKKHKKLSTECLICSGCKSEILENSNFCQNCGKKANLVCSGCDTPIVENSNFCANCGMKLE